MFAPPTSAPVPPAEPGPPLVDRLKQGYEQSARVAQNLVEKTSESVEHLADQMRVSFNNVADQASTGVGTASSSVSDFFKSNTLITKFAFVVLVIIAFLILVKIGIMAIAYATSKPANPYLIQGSIQATSNYIITRNTAIANNVQLVRSNNEKTGAEFTWSVWLFVNSLKINNAPPIYNHVFNVGSSTVDTQTGLMRVTNAPGLYFTSYSKNGQAGGNVNMHVVMDTEPFADYTADKKTTSHSQSVDVTELPYNNWFHVALRLENTVMDVYVNGTIAGRINFKNVPKQNFYDVNVCQNGGFQGNLSDLRYYPRALNVFEINSVVSQGPTLSAPKITGSAVQPLGGSTAGAIYDYISNLWYFKKM